MEKVTKILKAQIDKWEQEKLERLESALRCAKEDLNGYVKGLKKTLEELDVPNVDIITMLTKTEGRVRVFDIENDYKNEETLRVTFLSRDYLYNHPLRVPKGKYQVTIMIVRKEVEENGE
jgi:hypothetical protein